jgi:6-phosphofructokinase 1
VPPHELRHHHPLVRLGAAAVQAIECGDFGSMVALQGKSIRTVPLGDAVRKLKRVPVDGELMRAARRLGICFGDGHGP